MGNKRQVFQFKISLLGIEPPIWRRIQISDLCTFWSLHVAIQDAMGWEDYHLHEFIVRDSVSSKELHMGIPDEEDEIYDLEYLPGWEYKVKHYLEQNPFILYIYDFGDNWQHRIEFEGLHDKMAGEKYPRCIDGERHCPPEDVGSTSGYKEFFNSIKNKKHPNHAMNLR